MNRFFRVSIVLLFLGAAHAESPRTWVVDQHHAEAADDGPGTAGQPFRSIAPAAERAQPGDIVRVSEGVYRERVKPARGGTAEKPITYEAAEGETVIITGSDVLAGDWSTEPDGLEAHSIADLNFESHWHPYHSAMLRLPDLTCGMIFADGVRLVQARSRGDAAARPGSWWYDAAGDRVLVNMPDGARPKLIEAAVRGRVFAPHLRGLGHIIVRGFTIQHGAGQFPTGFWREGEGVYPQAGAIGTRSGHDWLIERNVIRENSNLGLDVGVEGKIDAEGEQPQPEDFGRHVVRANTFEANGACAIAGYRSPGVVIEGNRISGTNWQGHTAPETGGIKLHFAYDVRVEGNRVYDNDCYGIWLDNVYVRARVERNLVHNNMIAGIFVEMGGGPGVVAWNVVADNRGDGIYLHDASDVVIAHNLMALNRQFGFQARTVTERKWYDSRPEVRKSVPVGTFRVEVYNNIFIDNGGGAISLPFPSDFGRDNRSDNNLFLAHTQQNMQIDLERLWHLNLNNWKTAVPFETRVQALQPLEAYSAATGFLSLKNWRHATENDRGSRAQVPGEHVFEDGAVEQGGFVFRGLGGWLRFSRTGSITGMTCPPVEGIVGPDYVGMPVNNNDLRPGPFQTVADGDITMLLWPRPVVADADAETSSSR